ncbi:hypothetical protein QBC41DRAFT_307012 [Cercophora samala]|uniref:Uncharacterized protein n=1 Tax=Cercophora samala TaxID=330535 RepID=A0AA39Z354_9PEZI|nr:hypothetical protein QBC41DRAFT_307012 [Cercophora samala]
MGQSAHQNPSSACTDGDKVRKADDVSGSSCPLTVDVPAGTECQASSVAGVNQDRNLSVATDDSRRSSTGDADEPTKPACGKKAACDGDVACQEKEESVHDK